MLLLWQSILWRLYRIVPTFLEDLAENGDLVLCYPIH